MKTSELTGALLDYWVARAEGHAAENLSMPLLKSGEVGCVAHVQDDWFGECIQRLPYSTDWALCGPLIEKYGVGSDKREQGWLAVLDADYMGCFGTTPQQAICRAVVRAAFGDEVDEVPDA